MHIDIAFPGWSSRTEILRQRIDPLPLEALAATLDLEIKFAEDEPLPPGWHWLYFNSAVRRSYLAEDGHPRRDSANSFLPPVPLPRRMWAGSRIHYPTNLPIGAGATRTSRILNVTNKEGSAGKLCFVTVEHRISVSIAGSERDCIVEEQGIVYRETNRPQSSSVKKSVAPEKPVQWKERIKPDNVLLFRYSALTFNAHRIHYDERYACDVEGYKNLVVHGPLTATLLQNFARACKPDSRIARFEFKGSSPLFVNEALELQAWLDAENPNLLRMRALDQNGTPAMEASAQLEHT